MTSFAPIFALLALTTPAPDYDIVIREALVVDGTGNPWFRADIAIDEGLIVAVEREISGFGSEEIVATSLVAAPGFIDLHTHSRNITEHPAAEFFVRQGVTTIFAGPDGSSALPIADFLREVERAEPALNFGTFVGHGTIRSRVMGQDDRAPTRAELEEMRRIAVDSMREGAFGLSSGLFYTPGNFAETEELVEICRSVGALGGIYITHMRDEMGAVVESVAETIRIGEIADLPVQITHHKVIGRIHSGLGLESLELIDAARARGVDVTHDLYPYTASATSFTAAFVPQWAREGGQQRMIARLEDPTTRARIREFTISKLERERAGGDLSTVQIAWATADPTLSGKTLSEALLARGRSVTIENGADLVLELLEAGGVGGIFHAISEPDLVSILSHEASMIASDGALVSDDGGFSHPRCCGTFPRVLAKYVREDGILSLPEAIRKMTSFPARRVGLTDRGLIRVGMAADLVLFDSGSVLDRASFLEPITPPEGIVWVIVNGRIVVEQGELTGHRPGSVLHGPAYRNRGPAQPR